jgi:hypothetical protein
MKMIIRCSKDLLMKIDLLNQRRIIIISFRTIHALRNRPFLSTAASFTSPTSFAQSPSLPEQQASDRAFQPQICWLDNEHRA